jgi:hypothetical protein
MSLEQPRSFQRLGEIPMAKFLCFRVAGAIGLLSFAFFLGSFDPFLSAAPLAAIRGGDTTPAVAVDRSLKGDRLPVGSPRAVDSTALRHAFSDHMQSHAKVPVGCDPAFSPIFSSALGNFYGRCAT